MVWDGHEVDWVGVRWGERRWWWEVSETGVKERDSKRGGIGRDVEGTPGEDIEDV